MNRVGDSIAFVLGMALLATARAVCAAPEPTHQTTVGMPAMIEELILPAPQLEVKPLAKRDDPLILRMVNSYPHGSSFRYDLEYYALEPGEYNLADYMQGVGGAAAGTLPPLLVTVKPLLAPGQILPNPVVPGAQPTLGGYRTWVAIGGLAWAALGYAILVVGRKRQLPTDDKKSAEPITLADRLRPAVEAAVAGTLSDGELAELERTLFAFWRERLDLGSIPAAEAMRRLLVHPEAGQLMRQLEAWLHQPSADSSVDVAALLAPYRSMPADALNAPPSARPEAVAT